MMKTFAKVLALGAILAAGTSIAFADPLTGGFTLTGQSANDSTAGPGGTITFNGNQNNFAEETTGTGTGSFSGVAANTNIMFVSSFSFNSISPAGEQLFTLTSVNGSITEVFTFTVTGYSISNGTITLTGTLTEVGSGVGSVSGSSDATYTMYNIVGSGNNNPTGSLGSGPFDGSLEITPEPSSLLLLGTGLVGAAAVMFRKRRRAV